MHSRFALGFFALLACDSKPEAGATATATAPASAPAAAAGAKPSPSKLEPGAPATTAKAHGETPSPTRPKAAPTPLTKEARASYHGHLEQGRKLAKAKEWSKAIVELEAALAVIPGDDRALGELSWAAFSSGDHAKARSSAKAAVLAASDPKVKGAALYNLGRAEEALGELAAAKDAYEQSLVARPNEVVRKRLAELAARVPATEEPLPCSKPMDAAKICDCLRATLPPEAMPPDDVPSTCEVKDTGVDGFSYARLAISPIGEESVSLVARGPDGWSVVALLDYVYNPGAFGIFEEWELTGAHERTVGAHTLVEFTSHKLRTDSDMGVDEAESETTDRLIVCDRGDGKAPPRCPLALVTSYAYERDRMGLAEDGEIEKELQTPGLPIKRETKIAVTIGEDGVAKLRAETGSVDPAQLGDRKLW